MNRSNKTVDLSTPAQSLVAAELHKDDAKDETVIDAKDNGQNKETKTETKETPKPSTKPSGQSIAQVADADLGDEGDDDTEDGTKDGDAKKPDNGQDKSAKKGPSVFSEMLEFKKENRELKRMMREEIIPTMKEMQTALKNGSLSKSEAKDELELLAEKYELEPEFVKELAGAIKSKTTKEVEDKYLSDIKEIKEDREAGKKVSQETKIKMAISSEFDRVVAETPEYAKLAKKEVVAKLILSNEEYQSMAMEDVLAEVYGEIDKPGMDGYSPQGASHKADVDPRDLADKANLNKEELTTYADDLILRMNNKSRHAK